MNARKKLFAFLAFSALLCGLAVAGNSSAHAAVDASAKQALGIDVSNHNGPVNFKAVKKDGRNFAFILATDGASFTSELFDSQYRGAGKAGLFRGAYHFARPDSSATRQANHFLKKIDYRNDGKSLPPALDLEANPNGPTCYGLTHKQMKAWIKDFLGKVKETTKRDAIIYTSPAFWQECTGNSKAFKKNPLWIAQWGVSKPDKIGGWPDYTFWQYSDSGDVDGVNGKVDTDRFNGGVAKLRKLAQG
ncbi:MAG: lysozyme [Acidobacteria bacterium]|nr:lysozyme [Acidobacteriota bacterium]